MGIPIDLYEDFKLTAQFARDAAIAARCTLTADPGTRTREQLEAALSALGVVASRADQVLRAIAGGQENLFG